MPSAPQLRPGSRNSRCRAFGVGMGAPQGVQTRQSPVFPTPGRVFLKEIGMLATFISLLGSLAQAQIVWIGDVNTNFASQRVSNLGRIIGHSHFCCFFWCKQNYSKDDHSFWLPHSRLQEKPTCSQVGFFVAHAKFGLRGRQHEMSDVSRTSIPVSGKLFKTPSLRDGVSRFV